MLIRLLLAVAALGIVGWIIWRARMGWNDVKVAARFIFRHRR